LPHDQSQPPSTEAAAVPLHELDPSWAPAARGLDRASAYDAVEARLSRLPEPGGLVARLAVSLVQHCRLLTAQIDELAAEIETRVERLVPTLLAVVGVGPLTAAKILGETAGVDDRFRSKDSYARYTGTAPIPVWSSNRARHRLSRTGNRQLNAALHRMAMTQMRVYPPAKSMIERRRAGGDGGMEALRVLKRRLSDVVYAALRADLAITAPSLLDRGARDRGSVRRTV
jgi:transposase